MSTWLLRLWVVGCVLHCIHCLLHTDCAAFAFSLFLPRNILHHFCECSIHLNIPQQVRHNVRVVEAPDQPVLDYIQAEVYHRLASPTLSGVLTLPGQAFQCCQVVPYRDTWWLGSTGDPQES